MGTRAYLLGRLAQLPVVLLLITVLVFALMRVTPGDPVVIMLGVYASPETIAAVRRDFNLDRPLPVQYLLWLSRVLRGDLGRSIRTNDRVAAMVRTYLPVSLTLALLATLLSVLVAVPAGLLSALRPHSLLDHVAMGFAVLGLSVPGFALALILIFVFAVALEWVPVAGYGLVPFRQDPWGALVPFLLPAVALGTFHTAELARLLRSSMLDVLGREHIQVARAKGLSERAILLRHALKLSCIPLVTVVAINFVYMVGTTITLEHIFALPGVGTAMIQAVLHRDFPVIQGFTLVIGLLFLVGNLLADVLYVLLDPRIRYG